jgi:hypothetical protein
MAYRFTNTEKWQDVWFSGLKQLEMLLFLYLCDNCDIAGFIEVNFKRWSSDLNSSTETIKGALKGLQRGLVISTCEECIYIKNFLKHQKNFPINENNPAHKGILKRFELYGHKFNIENVSEFIEGASKGLPSLIGNGNGSIDTKVLSNIDTTKKFYENEKSKTDDQKYHTFVDFLYGQNPVLRPLERCLKLPKQVSYKSFCHLMAKAQKNKKKLLEITLDLDNYNKGNYTDLSLTLNKWLDERHTK